MNFISRLGSLAVVVSISGHVAGGTGVTVPETCFEQVTILLQECDAKFDDASAPAWQRCAERVIPMLIACLERDGATIYSEMSDAMHRHLARLNRSYEQFSHAPDLFAACNEASLIVLQVETHEILGEVSTGSVERLRASSRLLLNNNGPGVKVLDTQQNLTISGGLANEGIKSTIVFATYQAANGPRTIPIGAGLQDDQRHVEFLLSLSEFDLAQAEIVAITALYILEGGKIAGVNGATIVLDKSATIID